MKLKKITSKWPRIIQLTLFILCANGGETIALASADSVSVESSSWRFEFDNDILFNKDNKISNGWSLQKHSAVASSWETLEDVPHFVRNWAKIIPGLTEEALVYRAGIAIGQVIQTPDDLSQSDLIEDDVPYAGVLTLQATWYGFNNDEFRGFEFITGLVGPYSLAEQTQKVVHNLVSADKPMGWDNQLSTELIINFNYMRKQKIWRIGNPAGLSFDTTLSANAALGNLFTQASASIEMRFGHNMPGGFVSIPDPIGFSMHYLASLKPAKANSASFYTSLVLRGSAFAHNIFLDGNAFRDSHSVEKEPLVGLVILGFHYEKVDWGIHFGIIISSDNVDTSKYPAAENDERLGTLDIEWRF